MRTTIEPTGVIPEVYMWEITFTLRSAEGVKRVKKRIRTPDAQHAIQMAEEECTRERKWAGVHEHTTARLVDAYRDDDYPETECLREGCGVRYQGGGVYCSLSCAINDR